MAAYPEEFLHLLKTNGVAVLCTNGKSGYPQVTAVAYFLDDDGELKISLNTTRQKTKNLTANPKCTLFFIDPANTNRTIEVRAEAQLAPDPEFAFAARAGARYNTNFHNHDRPGETRVIVTLKVAKINTWDQGKRGTSRG
ncbi:MAG TPA: pyridoxamine 5'-phosphate oxidase family protein [Chloroflexota bacterium]|nr:pyridoxamine 5'-phosphate oxidase family protein [Chloroflexota bacterium]